jgi:hypothetical protein
MESCFGAGGKHVSIVWKHVLRCVAVRVLEYLEDLVDLDGLEGLGEGTAGLLRRTKMSSGANFPLFFD